MTEVTPSVALGPHSPAPAPALTVGAMTRRRRSSLKHYAKVALVAGGLLVGWDLYRGHNPLKPGAQS